jgi:3-oxoacyl-[acyl-carrier protein] reductase
VRVALITGSASGLGVQTVLALAEEGYHLAINYRKSKAKAEWLKKEVEKLGRRCLLVQGDISIKEDCYRIVEETIERFKRIDFLILNAGPYIFERKKMVDYADEEWEQMINGNLNSSFYLMKRVIPLMRQQRWGRVVTFGFNHAGQASGWLYRAAFAAAKVGLVSLTKSVAQEESQYGITANMVCPGDIVAENKEKRIEEVRGLKHDAAPVGRPGSGEDIARVIRFLCAEESDFLTGNVIEVNGGQDVLSKRLEPSKADKEGWGAP